MPTNDKVLFIQLIEYLRNGNTKDALELLLNSKEEEVFTSDGPEDYHNGLTALRLAMRLKTVDITKHLLGLSSIKNKLSRKWALENSVRLAIEDDAEDILLLLFNDPEIRDNAFLRERTGWQGGKYKELNQNLLFEAVRKPNLLEFVKQLLKISSGMSPAYNREALQLAIEHKNLDIAVALLDNPDILKSAAAIDLNKIICLAIKSKRDDLVKILLQKKELVQSLGEYDFKSLRLAVSSGNSEIIAMILDAMFNPSFSLPEQLATASYNLSKSNAAIQSILKYPDVLNNLLSKHALFRKPEIANSFIYQVIQNGNLPALQELRKMPVFENEISKDDATDSNAYLKLAVEHGYLDIVIELLGVPAIKRKVENDNTNNILKIAVKNNQLDVIDELLKIDAVKNRELENNAGLLEAIAKNNVLAVYVIAKNLWPAPSQAISQFVSKDKLMKILQSAEEIKKSAADFYFKNFLSHAKLGLKSGLEKGVENKIMSFMFPQATIPHDKDLTKVIEIKRIKNNLVLMSQDAEVTDKNSIVYPGNAFIYYELLQVIKQVQTDKTKDPDKEIAADGWLASLYQVAKRCLRGGGSQPDPDDSKSATVSKPRKS